MVNIRWTIIAAILLAPPNVNAQVPSPAANTKLFQEALRNSVLVEGNQPFHLVLEIAPDPTPRPHARSASDSMHASVEMFWINRDHYKLIVNSPAFRQTRTVDGAEVEEHDEGGFYPRWLDNFVRMLLDPVPHPQLAKLMQQRLSGGGTFAVPGRAAFTMPRCLETMERPGGITEETSVARMCFDASHPWYEGTLDFTRYVSFADYVSFGKQMVPRTWSNDIPENIFVQGKVTILERLSKSDAAAVHVTTPTPLADQIQTVFLSRSALDANRDSVPAFDWPTEDTEALDGYMIVYIRTDRAGKVRESYWSSSDNYKLQDAGVQYALRCTFKPTLVNGVPVQVEGPLVIHFTTHRSSSVQ
jgi:hypothetical protein